mmetsp:Transcript_30003/g.48846  ORF Transcript_30003/g.48846 Transcript_30003/m.48846 type:complete len:555 (-) Transcript_30003:156-1820(-)
MGRRRLFGGTATALALLFFITCLPLLLEAKGGGGGKEERNCAFQSIEELNEELLPTLKELVKAPFFKFYRLSLCAQCAHKFPPPMCASPDCAVCECSSSDLPCDQSGRCFLAPESESQNDGDPSCDGSDEEEARLNLFVDRNMMLPWSENDRDPWTYDGHPNGAELSYVDLTLNPERWSGYSEKQGSTDIWRAIYSENCKTKDEGGVCEGEEAVFLQKLISGLHTSITMHIVSDSCLKQQKHGECLQWGPDVEGFKQRVISDPSRVSNMKELYILLIKAIKKAGQALLRVDYTLQKGKKKGEEEEEKKEQSHDDIKKIIEVVTRAADRCEVTRSAVEALPPLQETRAVFRNISSIMDCLGCDKCKLWGKLQFQGVGTALRILYDQNSVQKLKRIEAIALINTAKKIAYSLHQVAVMRKMVVGDNDGEYPWKIWIDDVASRISTSISNLVSQENMRLLRENMPRIAIVSEKFKKINWDKLAYCFEDGLVRLWHWSQEIFTGQAPPPNKRCTHGERVRAIVSVSFGLIIAWWFGMYFCWKPTSTLRIKRTVTYTAQ